MDDALNSRLDAGFVRSANSAVTAAGRALLRSAMERLGLFSAARAPIPVPILRERLGIVPAYSRLFAYLIDILEADGCLAVDRRDSSVRAERTADPTAPDLSRLQRDFPDMSAILDLLSTCLEAYPDVLQGRRGPLDVLCPGGSTDLLEGVYHTGRPAEYFNDLAADLVETRAVAAIELGRSARILEIGAGTGATSRRVLARLAAHGPIRYDFTDISRSFVHRARTRWSERYPFAEFGVLDIEQDPSAQGFAPTSYDVVLAVHVLHATRFVRRALAHAARLLVPGGTLVLIEATCRHEFIGMTFGLTPGWWQYEDEDLRLPHSPLLSLERWREALANEGLTLTDVRGFEGDDMSNPMRAGMVAHTEPAAARVDVAPGHRQSVATRLLQIVAEVSGVEIGDHDTETNLFALGLDSLVLMQIKHGIEREFSVDVGLGQFHDELSTFARLSAWLAERASPAPIPTQPAVVPALIAAIEPAATPPQPWRHAPDPPARRAPSVVGDVAVSSMITDIVQQQLALMRQQLDVLGAIAGEAMPAVDPARPAVAATDAPVPEARLPRQPAPARPVAASSSEYERRTDAAAPVAALTRSQQMAIDRLIERYTSRTRQSKIYAAAARPVLADWIATIGFRPEFKELIYPIVSAGSKGSRMRDIDGHDYVDLAMGFGVGFFGHSPAFVTAAITAELERGFELATQSRLAAESARMIANLTGVERVVFSNTGTEAIMTSFRLARAVSGRRTMVIFKGSFHGSYDGVLAYPGRDTSMPMAPGILQHHVDDVLVLEYGSDEALRAIDEGADSIAGVLVEPVQSRNPDLQPRAFLQALRQLTEARGIALIFDELINGFRIHPGGAQAHFGVTADLVTYGKMLGGGMPISVVAGKARFIDPIDGGPWQFGDDSRPPATMTFFGGTFIRHPLAMAATHAALRFMTEQGPALQQGLNERTARLAERLNGIFRSSGTPFRIAWFSSQFQVRHVTARGETAHSFELAFFFFSLLEKGIYTWERRTCFLSIAHDDVDLERVVTAVTDTVTEMHEAGFFA